MRVRENTANLNEFKSPGSDGSHPKALKEVAEVATVLCLQESRCHPMFKIENRRQLSKL